MFLLHIESNNVGADCFTGISRFSQYFDNYVRYGHQIRHGGSSCTYLALRGSQNNKCDAIFLFFTFVVKLISAIIPPIIAQLLLYLHKDIY